MLRRIVDEQKTSFAAWLESTEGVQTPIHGSCVLGRAVTSTIVVAGDKVSRRHAMVHAQGHGEFWLIDHGSANGTYLNGRRVTAPCRLSNDDRIQIASHTYTFHQRQATGDRVADRTNEETIQDIKTITCWLLVADIESHTQIMQQLQTEDVAHLTGTWLNVCREIIERHGGSINKFLGDGFFAYWLAEEPVAASVGRALALLKALQEREAPRFRMVLHHGRAFLGGTSLGEESLLGGEVNFLFRLEKMAKELGVMTVITEAANQPALQAVLPTTSIGSHPVRSFTGDFALFTA